jgi:hypothetical protein
MGAEIALYGTAYLRDFWNCATCDLVFIESSALPNPEQERSRYLEHNNTEGDAAYQEYLSGKLQLIDLSRFTGKKALDFGCGQTRVLEQYLQALGIEANSYDPIFKPTARLLEQRYSLITCIEVAEHFHCPAESFKQLSQLLEPSSCLVLGTHLLDESVEFESWWYLRDKTHVSLYSQRTIEWIARFLDMRVQYQSNNISILIAE